VFTPEENSTEWLEEEGLRRTADNCFYIGLVLTALGMVLQTWAAFYDRRRLHAQEQRRPRRRGAELPPARRKIRTGVRLIVAAFHCSREGLNAERVPCPRGRCWAMTGVREMVYRELYRVQIVYGKTRWDYTGGKHKVRVPESEWLTLEAPALRIVPEELWRAAHARLDRTRQTYLRSTGGKLWGRPEAGIEARHLLTGFVTCGACGGAMHAIKRTSRRGRAVVYFTCNDARVNRACDNRLSVPVTAGSTPRSWPRSRRTC
jgi:recombinase/recombinase-like zinc beta ribbon protein